MLRLRARLPQATADAVLAPLLACAPLGVHERREGGEVDLVLHGAADDLRRPRGLLGGAAVLEPAPEDAHERLAAVLRPARVGTLAVRPAWMAPDPEAAEEIVIADAGAFGAGGHPTTRACLEWVLALPAGGGFADLGCGSGVLAIAAARRGRAPVVAVDAAGHAVEAAAANARENDAAVEVRRADLLREPPPALPAAAANVPAAVHAAIAAALPPEVQELAASGFGPGEAEAVAAAYARAGLAVADRRADGEWVTLTLRRGGEGRPPAGGEAAAAEATGAHAIADIDDPTVMAARWAERGAHCALLDLGGGVHLDVWPLGDSLRWAVRAEAGMEVEILAQQGEGRRVAMSLRAGRRRADAVVDVGPGPVHALRGAARVSKLDAPVNFS